jgi:hypothetical protein
MKYFFVGIALVWTLTGCREDKTKGYKNHGDFFTNPKFGGDYAKTLPLHSVDSTVERIALDVPSLRILIKSNVYFRMIPFGPSLNSYAVNFLAVKGASIRH